MPLLSPLAGTATTSAATVTGLPLRAWRLCTLATEEPRSSSARRLAHCTTTSQGRMPRGDGARIRHPVSMSNSVGLY